VAAFEFATAARIVFGAGKSAEIAAAARAMGHRAMLVGSPRWRHLLPEAEVAFEVRGEPTVDVARAGTALARAEQCDVVVAIGGGSAIDAGKAIAALAANPGDVLDYIEVIGAGRPLQSRPLPFIAVPTTSGTGAEVTRNAVLGSPGDGVKASLRSPAMLPSLAIVDPELTRSLPREVAAYTGLDALTQLIEPLVSVRANAMSDMVARQGLALAVRGIRTLDREFMAQASLLSGMALANSGLGAVHAFAAAIGGMQIDDRVRDIGGEFLGGTAVGLMHFREGERSGAERFEDFVILFDLRLESVLERFRLDQVDHSQSGAGGFVTVGRADAAFGGADLVFAFENLALLVEFAVIRQDDVRRFGNEKVIIDFDPELFEAVDFVDETDGIDDDAVADDAHFAFAKDAGRDEMQDVFLFADEDRVSRVVTALRAHDDVGVTGEDIDDFAFAFVAPLGAYQDRICHSWCGPRPLRDFPTATIKSPEF